MSFFVVEVDNDGFKVYDSGGTLIDPAKDTTVAAITTELQAIQSTTGIKAIIDPLPAGTNNIGDVDLASAIPAGANIIGLIKLVDTGGVNVLAVDASGRAAIQDPPNLDVALSTRATEATLLAADGRLTTIDAVLDSIKDVDGIKKITDPVVIGTGDVGIGRVKVWDGTEVADVYPDDGVNYLAAGKSNKVDPNNSSVAQLGNGGVFAGTATDVSNYSSVAVTLHSDQNSALDGMKFQFSIDGTNWDDSYNFNLIFAQGSTRRFQFPITAQYFRVHYTNGTTPTTAFRVQTILHRENILTSIHRVEDVVREDRSAQIVKSVLIAQREGALNTSFYPVQADISGNLKVTTIGADIPPDPTAFVLEFLENGGSNNMRVDGSVTPVIFSKGPTVTNEQWSLRELLLTFTADDFSFDGLSFGPNSALTNGFILEIVKNSITTPVFTVKQNEDFLRVPGRTPLVNNTGPKDVLGASLSFDGLILSQSTGDYVQIRVRDDLTSIKLKYLTATMFATRVV